MSTRRKPVVKVRGIEDWLIEGKVSLVPSTELGISNFPSSHETAREELVKVFNVAYGKGYSFKGAITRAVGPDTVTYYVFEPK